MLLDHQINCLLSFTTFMYIKFTSYGYFMLKNLIENLSINFYTFSILKVLIIKFTWNSLNKFKNVCELLDGTHRALQLCSTSNLNYILTLFYITKLNKVHYTFCIHSNIFSIVKYFIIKIFICNKFSDLKQIYLISNKF